MTAEEALTKVSRAFLFWFAFILTRPLGAVVGDFLDKPCIPRTEQKAAASAH